MSHGPHQGTYTVLEDDCEECIGRAGDLNGLSQLDDNNLQELARLATLQFELPNIMRPSEIGASYLDIRAVETLRLAARLVYRSGISEQVSK